MFEKAGGKTFCMGWWAEGDLLRCAEGVRQVLEVIGKTLPEALPTGWDVDESYSHLMKAEGVGALAEFIDAHRDDSPATCLQVAPPAREITLQAPRRRSWGNGGGPLELSHMYIELDEKILRNGDASLRIYDAFVRIAEIVGVFYAECRWRRGVNVLDATDLAAQEVYPINGNRWCGLPHRPPVAAVLGNPYRKLWTAFGDRDVGPLRISGPTIISGDDPVLSWDPPTGLMQPFDRQWKMLSKGPGGKQLQSWDFDAETGWVLSSPQNRSDIWPFEKGSRLDVTPVRASMWDEEFRQPRDDEEGLKTRAPTETVPDMRAVDVQWTKSGTWSITVPAMELVRGAAEEGSFRGQINSALNAVAGVRSVAMQDREIWLVSGESTTHDLVTAVAAVIDMNHELLRRYGSGGDDN